LRDLMLERVILSKALAIVRFISPFLPYQFQLPSRFPLPDPKFREDVSNQSSSRLSRVFQDLLDLG